MELTLGPRLTLSRFEQLKNVLPPVLVVLIDISRSHPLALKTFVPKESNAVQPVKSRLSILPPP